MKLWRRIKNFFRRRRPAAQNNQQQDGNYGQINLQGGGIYADPVSALAQAEAPLQPNGPYAHTPVPTPNRQPIPPDSVMREMAIREREEQEMDIEQGQEENPYGNPYIEGGGHYG